MRVWCQDFYTEAHRTPERQFDLIQSFTKIGVTLTNVYDQACDLAFCGSVFTANAMRDSRGLPTVHYNWDLYPHVIYNFPKTGWADYLVDLRRCTAVVVPNEGTRRRTKEFTRRESTVVHAPVKVWDVPTGRPDGVPDPGTYALDVMRDYNWDAGFDTPRLACLKAGMELVRTQTKRPWDEFRWLVANAKCLISAVDEASTGGLTLLEGFAHGVPVVISDSPLNGGGEYLGGFAHEFDYRDSIKSLTKVLKGPLPTVMKDDARRWVEATYSDDRFVANLKEVFKLCLTSSPSPKT